MFNSESVKNLAHSNSTASAIFLLLSQRERARRFLNLTLLKRSLRENNVEVNEKDFFMVFKELQKLHVGDLIHGRKGNPDIFVWYYDLKDVAVIGLGVDEKITSKELKPLEPMVRKPRVKKLSELAAIGSTENPHIQVSRTQDRQIMISIPIEMLKNLR